MNDKMVHKCSGCRYKSEHQEMGFRPFGVCVKERDLIAAHKAYDAEVCPFQHGYKGEQNNGK